MACFHDIGSCVSNLISTRMIMVRQQIGAHSLKGLGWPDDEETGHLARRHASDLGNPRWCKAAGMFGSTVWAE